MGQPSRAARFGSRFATSVVAYCYGRRVWVGFLADSIGNSTCKGFSVADEAAKETKGKGGSNLLVILLLVVVLALGGISFWLWKSKGEKPGERTPEKPKVESVLKLEPFVLNLTDPEAKTYLRVTMELGLSKPSAPKEKKEGGSDAGPPVALVRDTILTVLAVGKSEELLTPEGKAKLKEELLGALQKRAPDLGAEEIYFTEFLIQR
jgi:flagellar FliL protein